MSALQGLRGQDYRDRFYDASGTITSGSAAQLVLPEAKRRSSLIFINNSANTMYLEIGAARATATLTNGVVTSVTVTNAGFGYTIPPTVEFIGGAYPGQETTSNTFTLPIDPSWPTPQNKAKAHCNMTGSGSAKSIASITVDGGGALYQYPPYVLITNSLLDPWGAAVPSATVGIELEAGGSYSSNGSFCTTDQIAVFCATATSSFSCKYSF